MATRPVSIGSRSFKTTSAAKRAVQEVLRRYRPGQRLSSEDEAFMVDVLKLHEEADEKIGCGVATITVENNRKLGFATNGFYVTRTDGSKTDFSYLNCLSPRTHREDVLRAFRQAIADQVVMFKLTALSRGGATCAITGAPLRGDESTHVDHDPPFLSLVTDFLSMEGLTFDSVEVLPTSDMSASVCLRDVRTKRAFCEYHKSMARLRLVTKSANLARKRTS